WSTPTSPPSSSASAARPPISSATSPLPAGAQRRLRQLGHATILQADAAGRARHRLPTYWAARLLTRAWAEPVDGPHRLYPTSVRAGAHHLGPEPALSAYALHRPDGRWAVLVVNREPRRSFTLDVRFAA